MNILDENILQGQRELLQRWGIPFRQIVYEVGKRGIQDEDIIPLLLRLGRPTFFTHDLDFYKRNLCHAEYCVVYMEIHKYEAALYVRRLLRHPDFNTQAKRMGAVIRVAPSGLTVWGLHTEQEVTVPWPN